MRAYQNMPYSLYIQRNSSEYIYSVHHLTGHLQGIILQGLKLVSSMAIASFIILFLAYRNLLEVSILIAIIAITLYIYDFVVRKNVIKIGESVNFFSTKMMQGIQEGMNGFKEIRILGSEEFFYKKLEEAAKSVACNNKKSLLIQDIPKNLIEIVVILFIVILVSVLLNGDNSKAEIIATLGIFGIAAVRLAPMATIIARALNTFRASQDSLNILFDDYNLVNAFLTQKEHVEINSEHDFKNISLEGIDFKYPNSDKKTLRDLKFKINQGKFIGIIGESGSGKTTLVDIILGLLEPSSGQIVLNDVVVTSGLNQKEWKSQVAYIPQDIFLIDNTLRSNIIFGKGIEANEEKLTLAIKQAQLTSLVDQLPEGLNTIVGEKGIRLSGGQRQRIALARAFYHDRNILVMDESTNALDSTTENMIIIELERLKGLKTLIVIAHRLSTIKNCDWVYEMEDGKIINQGIPEQFI